MRALVFSLALLVLAACSATRDMRVRTHQRAALELPADVQTILVVNRTEGGVTAKLEGVVNMSQALQASLAEECLGQAMAGLQAASRYQVKKHDRILRAAGPASAGFGTALSWAEVDRLCKTYQADALVALEYLDGDFVVTQVPILTPPGVLQAHGVARTTAGFRIYQPKTQTILLQTAYPQQLGWTEQAANPLEALAKLLKGPEALREVSRASGQNFGAQFIARDLWAPRLMFVGRRNAQMTRGYRLALVNQWAEARDAWGAAYNQATKAKTRGRAAYNIALAHEVLGDLPAARDWAGKAFVEHGDPRAQRYGYVLENRMAAEGR